MLDMPLYDRNDFEKEAQLRDDSLHSLVCFSENGITGYQKMAYPLGIGSKLKQDRMYQLQSQLVLERAEQESCVIIGRCADYLLRERDNVIRCYIFAPYQARIVNSIQALGYTAAEPQVSSKRLTRRVRNIIASTPVVRSTTRAIATCSSTATFWAYRVQRN